MRSARARIVAALAKPLPADDQDVGKFTFNPWEDVIEGISGGYSSQSDAIAIEALEAARDRTTFDFISRVGYAGEFMLYVFAGHGMVNYGTSPRGCWPDETITELWQPLIDKWRAYYVVYWGEPVPAPGGAA